MTTIPAPIFTAVAYLAQQVGPDGKVTTAPPWMQMAPLLLMFVVFYFLLIRPQQKRAKEIQQKVDSIETGDEVVTASGIVGVVTNRKEKTLVIRTADTKIEVLKSAVQDVVKPKSGEKSA
jgi:preprotein translocase subunit YajC